MPKKHISSFITKLEKEIELCETRREQLESESERLSLQVKAVEEATAVWSELIDHLDTEIKRFTGDL